MIQLECSSCKSSLQVATKYAGKRAKCAKCDNVVSIPFVKANNVFCICCSCKANFNAPDQPQLALVKCPKCSSDFELPGNEEMIGNGTTVRFTCEHCKQKYCVASKYAGKKFGCPNCKHPCTVPQLIEEEDEGEMVLDLDEFNDNQPAAAEYDAMENLDLMPDDGIESVPKIGRREYTAPKAKTPKQRSSGSSGAGSSSAASTLIAIACVAGFYIALLVGAMFFAGKEPIDNSKAAITYNRQLIFDMNKGRLNNPDGLLEFIDLADTGRLPQNDGGLSMALGMIEIGTIEPKIVHTKLQHGASGYLVDNVVTSKEGDVLNVQVAVSELHGQFDYIAAVVSDVDGYTIAASDDTDPQMMKTYIDDFVAMNAMPADSMIFYMFIAFLLVGLLNLISVWRVLEMQGQPGWAAIVPIYREIALAQVGDRPALLGLACYLPIVGWLAFIYIAIGIAASYDRGILFGLGLAFLPFIFFPVLAFTENRF